MSYDFYKNYDLLYIALSLIAGIVTMAAPDVNTIFLPIEAETVQESHFARSYAGFVAAVGYLALRFLYSSSKVQVGTVVMYIFIVMIISKIFSFIYDGYTNIAVIFLYWHSFCSWLICTAKS